MADNAKDIISRYENVELRIEIEEHPAAVVVRLIGLLVLGESGDLFRGKMRELAARSDLKKVVLDCGGVTYVNSGGIGNLVATFTNFRNRGIECSLVNLPKKIKDLLQITKLYTVFPVYDSAEQALAS
jgi:anti-sigma B factor antagonist